MATGVFRRVLGWLLGVYEVTGAAPRLVVATPPGQVHELGALMVAVSAAAEGGGDLPGTRPAVADLLSAAEQTGARAVAISVVYVPDDHDFLAALADARGSPARVPLLLGGRRPPNPARDGSRRPDGDQFAAGASGTAAANGGDEK